MLALPPKLQTLNGFRVVYPPKPPIKGGLYVWKKQQLLEAFRQEKLKQVVGCVCVCVCVCVKAFKSMWS